jgi:hypothetical protein
MITATAKPEDAFELALREEDQKEVGPGWRELVALSITQGPVKAIAARDREGNLLGLAGISVADGEATPWLLCSERMAAHKVALWRSARCVVAAMREQFGDRLIYNFIPKSSTRNRAFVQRLGFRIVPSRTGEQDFFYLPPCVNQPP